jgi:hypothetical protein
MGRPRRWKAIRITSFYIPVEFEEKMSMFEELARREGKTTSGLLLEAISHLLEIKYPGNPQPPLDSFTGKAPLSLTLKAKLTSEKLEQQLKSIEERRGDQKWLKQAITKPLLTLAKLNETLKDKKYELLIEKTRKVMGL